MDNDSGLIDQIRSLANTGKFRLREKVFGRLVLRRGLPKLFPTEDLRREASFYRIILEKAFELDPGFFNASQSHMEVWDIGCRNWSYLGALAGKFPRARLRGVELDAKRRYWNLFRRGDYAEAYARLQRDQGRDTRFFAGDFLSLHPKLDLPTAFCFFFPFVSEEPCLKWGLPLAHSNYQGLVQHARTLGETSPSWLLSIHQGEWEADIAKGIYSRLGVIETRQTHVDAEVLSPFWGGSYSVFIFLARLSA